MVPAFLREKAGMYYIVVSYYDEEHKRKQIWISTKLKVKGNKRKAETMLEEYQRYYDVIKRELVYEDIEPAENSENKELNEKKLVEYVELSSPLFGDYIYNWNEELKDTLQVTTYNGYRTQIQRAIMPYFNQKGITLHSITAEDIRIFYKSELKKVSASTIRKYHANIRKCLQEAFQEDKIPFNPADKVKLPKGDTFVGDYYNKEELLELLSRVKGTKLEFPVSMAIYYGLRRSEIGGLKWSAVDFNYKTITIMHTVVYCSVDGRAKVVAKDRTKTNKSLRTLPLMPEIEEMLIRMKEEQKQNKKFLKSFYKEEGYIYVLEDGTPVNPDYITKKFIKFIKVICPFASVKTY